MAGGTAGGEGVDRSRGDAAEEAGERRKSVEHRRDARDVTPPRGSGLRSLFASPLDAREGSREEALPDGGRKRKWQYEHDAVSEALCELGAGKHRCQVLRDTGGRQLYRRVRACALFEGL